MQRKECQGHIQRNQTMSLCLSRHMFQTMNCVNRHCWLCLGVVYLMLQVLFPNWQTRLPHVSCIDSWLFIGNIYFSLSLSLALWCSCCCFNVCDSVCLRYGCLADWWEAGGSSVFGYVSHWLLPPVCPGCALSTAVVRAGGRKTQAPN